MPQRRSIFGGARGGVIGRRAANARRRANMPSQGEQLRRGAEFVAGTLPVVGEAMDARDLAQAVSDRDLLGAALSGAGLALPLVPGRVLRRAADQMADRSRPLRGYHGTNEAFDDFDVTRIGSATDEGLQGRGFYFFDDPKQASFYAEDVAREAGGAPNVRIADLDVQNPLVLDYTTREGRAQARQLLRQYSPEELTAFARSRGHDGIIYRSPQGFEEYTVFDASQIRPAFRQGN